MIEQSDEEDLDAFRGRVFLSANQSSFVWGLRLMEHLSSIWIVGTVASLFLIVCEVCLASGLKRCTLFVSC